MVGGGGLVGGAASRGGGPVAEIPCLRCRTTGIVPDPGVTRWQCRACGHSYFLRRCSACRRVSYVDGFQGYNQSWACTWCAQPNRGFRQRRARATATAGELAGGPAPVAGGGPGLGGFWGG